MGTVTGTRLPPAAYVLAVCAHPDDESFGLGAVLSGFRAAGAEVDVLCFTRGEASSLTEGAATDLAGTRADEFECAATRLGLREAILLDYPDGALSEVPVDTLASHLEGARPDLLLVFDEDGISGHPDHRRATEVAIDWGRRRGVRVLAWAVSPTVAIRLNSEFGTRFAGRAEVDFIVRVDRTAQREAISCHQSQASANPVLWRRLELMGDEERLRWIPT